MEKRVLVVDDSVVIVKSLSFMLKREKYQVYNAYNGKEAVEKIPEIKPHLVFCDIMMPQMDGYEVCRTIKGNPELKNIHIIMLTAKGESTDREKGFEMGADEYLTKPFSPSKVSSLVKDVFSKLEQQGALQ